MSEHGLGTRTFDFTNHFGERRMLIARLDAGVTELPGDELDGESVKILDDTPPAGLILGEDEFAWLNECWEAVFGRRLRPSPAQRLVEALVGLSKLDRPDPSPKA